MWSGNKKWVKGGSLYDFYLVEWAGVNPENGNPTWYRYNTNGEKITTEDYSSTTPDDKVKCGNHYQIGPAVFNQISHSRILHYHFYSLIPLVVKSIMGIKFH